eukprot:Opistho-2@26862
MSSNTNDGPKVCAVCSRDNDSSSHHCVHCGALLVSLPPLAPGDASVTASVTPRGTIGPIATPSGGDDRDMTASLAPGPSTVVILDNRPQGRRKILIQRDYSHGMAVRYEETPQVQPLTGTPLSSASVQRTVQGLNEIFYAAEHIGCCGYFEGCLACLSGFALYWCIRSPYEKSIQQMREFVHDENERVYHPSGFHIKDPMENGLRMIEIVEL